MRGWGNLFGKRTCTQTYNCEKRTQMEIWLERGKLFKILLLVVNEICGKTDFLYILNFTKMFFDFFF